MHDVAYVLVCLALGLAVWFDARRVGMQGLPGGRDGTFNANTWGLVVVLLPPAVVIYLWRRQVHRRRAELLANRD